jgi:glycosyltransferase involved in cell wall biosynthesis
VREERKGISFARNRALRQALDLGADAIVFIDDDEVPDPEWLDGLLQVHRSSGAEVISGPVLPWFEEPVPNWVIKGHFFDRGRFPTGTEIPFARTGNLLLDTRFLKKSGLLFDERFGLTGGEDTLLTLQLKKLGARIVWADNAPVRESVPRNRATVRYILRRSFVGGNNWTRIECLLNPSPLVLLKRAAIACGRVAQGALLLVPSVVLGRHAVIQCAAKAYLGMGSLLGLLRFNSKFYQ